MFFSNTAARKEKLCEPLKGPPPGRYPCNPTLLLGIPRFIAEELHHVLINDLVYSRTSKLQQELNPRLSDLDLLQILENLSGSDLINLTKAYNGSILVLDDDIYVNDTDQVSAAKLEQVSALAPFQAIVVHSNFVYEDSIREFTVMSYNQHGTSVVYMSIEGIFDMSALRQAFGIDWNLSAYTKRQIQLTASQGHRILGRNAFHPHDTYTKAHYVTSRRAEEELFAECVDPTDYEGEDDDEMPAPSPGSPALAHIDGNKSVSYFGFVNSLDVSYGAIMYRLCFAAEFDKVEKSN
ncbi:hypothetical protein MPSEU_001083500 [Mayamaea pseudoterrestris]|nr:hypothetical protein MPSEU_001083500 [Mayamaea pseudoterrestris]